MDFYIIAIFLLFGTIIGARLINERGLKKLSQEEKALLVDTFSTIRKYQLIPVVALILGYFISVQYFPENVKDIFIIYFVLLALMVAAINYIVYQKLKKAGITEEYIKTYILSEVIKTGGMIACFALLIFSFPK